MAFEADPAASPTLRRRGRRAGRAGSPPPARRSLDVELPDNELRRIAALCAAFDVDGMRADLVVARTAVAHAAWRGAARPSPKDDIRVAAELALPHRRRRDPFDDPGWTRTSSTRRCAQAGESAEHEPEPEPVDPDRPAWRRSSAGDGIRSRLPPQGDSHPPARAERAAVGDVPDQGAGGARGGGGRPGRRSRARNRTGNDRWTATDGIPRTGHGLHVFAHCWPPARTPAAGRPRSHRRRRRAPRDARRPRRQSGDLRRRRLRVRWPPATGWQRSAGRRCRCCATPTSVATRSRRDHLPRQDGQRAAAADVVGAHRGPPAGPLRHRRENAAGARPAGARDVVVRGEGPAIAPAAACVVVLTDGRATGGPDPLGRTRIAARLLVAEGAAAVVVDCETSYRATGFGRAAGRANSAPPAVRLAQLRAAA